LTTSRPSKSSPEPLFDEPGAYDEMLGQGLSLTGEGKGFFIAGRIAALCRMLPEAFRPARILDYGCGVGDGALALAAALAGRRHESRGIDFVTVDEIPTSGRFDLIVCSGVLHHVEPDDRQSVLGILHEALVAGGCLAVFENNPYNPGTRWVMARIPFDRDAVPLRPGETRSRLKRAGFGVEGSTRYLFFFPRFLARLRPLEVWLARLPLGGQYGVLARRSS